MEIKQLQEAVRTARFTYGGYEEHATYRLGMLNKNVSGNLFEWIEQVVVSWSLTNQGEPILPTQEQIDRFSIPSSYLQAVMSAIYDDSDPKQLQSSPLSTGS